MDEHSKYESDQQYFGLNTVKEAVVDIPDLPPDIDLEEGEHFDIFYEVRDAFPLPEIEWRINAEEYLPELVEQSPPVQDAEGRYSFSQTVR